MRQRYSVPVGLGANVPKAIDLFCGCGGMSLGAARAGFDLAAAADNDQRALKVHSNNFPNCKHLLLDLSKTPGKRILEDAEMKHGEVDVLFGGPPCQGFSPIGKRDIHDERNERLVDFFRLVSEIQPSAFVVENVPGVLNSRYAQILEAAQRLVRQDYIVLEPYKLKALEAGAPTVRTRVVVVGFKNRIGAPGNFWHAAQQGEVAAPVVKHALQGLPLDVNPNHTNGKGGRRVVRISRQGRFFESAAGRVPDGVGELASLAEYFERSVVTGCIGTVHSGKLERRYASLAYGEMDPKTKSVKLDPNGFCPTLRAGTGPEKGSFQAVRPIHYSRPRVITPREAARLQGFPDWFQFDSTKWHTFRYLGNSVSPLVSEFVMERVATALR